MSSTTKKQPRIPIMELFGPTVQGEGLMTGTLTHFLRTGGCGLRCTWCDSMHAVEPAQIKAGAVRLTTPEIWKQLTKLPWAPWLTLTGGDPCLHKHLDDIIVWCAHDGRRVAVETQGQLFPEWLGSCDTITFSPKGPSSGNVVDLEVLAKWIVAHRESTMMGRVCIKIVIFTEADFLYAMQAYNMIPYWAYDAFYFTAGTPPYDANVPPADRILDVTFSYRILAERILQAMHQEGFKPNNVVHVGCQQHVVLWPTEEKGV